MGQHGAHLGPVGPRWAPCWPHEPCYQGNRIIQFAGHVITYPWNCVHISWGGGSPPSPPPHPTPHPPPHPHPPTPHPTPPTPHEPWRWLCRHCNDEGVNVNGILWLGLAICLIFPDSSTGNFIISMYKAHKTATKPACLDGPEIEIPTIKNASIICLYFCALFNKYLIYT